MSFELSPRTPHGATVVAAAEALVEKLADRAQDADASNEVCPENVADLTASGIVAAFVPEELGGFGLESIHDWVLTIVTLARGDASTAIAVNMHLGVSRGMALAYRDAQANLGPDHPTTHGLAEQLRRVVSGDMLICATATERGTDNLHPMTEAVREGEGDSAGWRINGRKIFVTLSPVATHLAMNLRMRDSGSQSVVFEDVSVPLSAVHEVGPWGQWSVTMLQNRTVANIPLVGAFLGIAEAAHEIALTQLASRSRLGQPVSELSGVRHVVGEMTLELARSRAALAVAATEVDEYFRRHAEPGRGATIEDAHRLMADYQVAKWTVNAGAIDVVSKAMDLLGGSGYTNAHVLARLYRDVRAGPFMQPFGATELREYVGRIALEQWPKD